MNNCIIDIADQAQLCMHACAHKLIWNLFVQSYNYTDCLSIQIVFVEPASIIDELSEKYHFKKSDVVSLSDR